MLAVSLRHAGGNGTQSQWQTFWNGHRQTRVLIGRLMPWRGLVPGVIWVLQMAYLRFSKSRQSRLQDCRLRWLAAAELRGATRLPQISARADTSRYEIGNPPCLIDSRSGLLNR